MKPLPYARRILLTELMAKWTPGDEWSWDDETANILAADPDYQVALERHLLETGNAALPPEDDPGIWLGLDGRVWNGHRRIIGAHRLGYRDVPLAEGSAGLLPMWLHRLTMFTLRQPQWPVLPAMVRRRACIEAGEHHYPIITRTRICHFCGTE